MNAEQTKNALTVIDFCNSRKRNLHKVYDKITLYLTHLFLVNKKLCYLLFLELVICAFFGSVLYYKQPVFANEVIYTVLYQTSAGKFAVILFLGVLSSFTIFGKYIHCFGFVFLSVTYGFCISRFNFLFLSSYNLSSILLIFHFIIFIVFAALFNVNCVAFSLKFKKLMQNNVSKKINLSFSISSLVYILILYILFLFLSNNYMIG